MPLYDSPNIKTIESFLPEISKGNIDFVKLIKGGLTEDIPYGFRYPGLFKIPSGLPFGKYLQTSQLICRFVSTTVLCG